MKTSTSLAPIASQDFGPAEARHLLWRAGFGASPSQVKQFAQLGLDAAVKRMVDYAGIDASALPEPDIDQDVLRPRNAEERKAALDARRSNDQDALDRIRRESLAARGADRRQFVKLQQWWIDRMIQTPRPSEERLTLLWHGHFASSYRSVRDAWLMYQQNQMLRENANGSFADLAAGIVRDPAMIVYLNNNRNNARKPNENLARELMELFTLGEGNYSEDDIKQGARALTGYTYRDNDFVFNERSHDGDEKTILGQTGKIDGDEFVQILLKQPSCAKFITMKIYDHFVADVGDVYERVPAEPRNVIDRLAELLRKENYAIQPVLLTLFKSQHFYDAGIVGQKIKDPIQVAVGTIRSLGTPTRSAQVVGQTLNTLGQSVMTPPTVDGWDGGRGWVNTSTLLARQNLTTYLISGKRPGKNWNKSQVNYEPEALLAELPDRDTRRVTDHLLDHMVGPHVTADRRAPIHKFMADRKAGVTSDSLVALLCLITSMPEYQLC